MQKRQPGLDLLRCLALLGVVTFHFFLNNGYHYEAQKGFAMWLAGSARALSIGCNGLFLMLTGYLRSSCTDIRRCWRALPPVLLGYVLAAVVSIPIRHFAFGDVQSLSVWVSRLFRFQAVYYGWYVEMFIGLTLLSPFVNLLLAQLKSAGALYAFAGTLLFLTALPGATPLPLAPDHWRNLYPLSYYVLGALVKRLQPKVSAKVGLPCALGIAALLGAATVLSTDGNLSTAFIQEFADLWITAIVVCLFVSLYRLDIRPRAARCLAFLCGGCYGAYLLSHLLDAWCYRLLPQWRVPEHYWKLFLVVTVPIFILSLLAGRLLQRITDKLLTFAKRIPRPRRRSRL